MKGKPVIFQLDTGAAVTHKHQICSGKDLFSMFPNILRIFFKPIISFSIKITCHYKKISLTHNFYDCFQFFIEGFSQFFYFLSQAGFIGEYALITIGFRFYATFALHILSFIPWNETFTVLLTIIPIPTDLVSYPEQYNLYVSHVPAFSVSPPVPL